MANLDLSSSSRRAFDRLAVDLERVFGTRFVALVAYGGGTGMAFATSVVADDLDALGPLVERWHRDGLATPLLMSPDEFQRSLDAFPLEFQAILDRHLVIAGQPPFAGVTIQTEDLRHACEVQARSFLIHIRQGWLQCAGHEHDIEQLLVRSAQPFRALLGSVARLQGVAGASDAQIADVVSRAAGLRVELVQALLAAESQAEKSGALAARMPDVLAAAETLWNFVDAWHAT